MKFIQGWHLKQHMRMHENIRPWKCERCGKCFRTKSSLQHHERGHLGIKNYQCEICGKHFSTKKYLRDHHVIHTDLKPFKCTTCGQDFNQVSNLKRHERIHSDERKYKCRFCDKSFKYINSWRYHEGIHTNERAQCNACGLFFRSKNGLKKHRCDPSKYDENIQLPRPPARMLKETPATPKPSTRTALPRRARIHSLEPVVQLEKIDMSKQITNTSPSKITPPPVKTNPPSLESVSALPDSQSNEARPQFTMAKYDLGFRRTFPVPNNDPNLILLKQMTKIKQHRPRKPIVGKNSTSDVPVKKISGDKKIKKLAAKKKDKAVKLGKIKLGTSKKKKADAKIGKKTKKTAEKKVKKVAKAKAKKKDATKVPKKCGPKPKSKKNTASASTVCDGDVKLEGEPWPVGDPEPVSLHTNLAAMTADLDLDSEEVKVKVEIIQSVDDSINPCLILSKVNVTQAGERPVETITVPQSCLTSEDEPIELPRRNDHVASAVESIPRPSAVPSSATNTAAPRVPASQEASVNEAQPIVVQPLICDHESQQPSIGTLPLRRTVQVSTPSKERIIMQNPSTCTPIEISPIRPGHHPGEGDHDSDPNTWETSIPESNAAAGHSKFPPDPVFSDLGIEIETNWGENGNTKETGISEKRQVSPMDLSLQKLSVSPAPF